MKVLVVVSSVAALSGCVPHVRPDPSKITIKDAMVSVALGLEAMRKELGCQSFGLYADGVKVTFSVTASEDAGLGLVIDKAPHLGPIIGSGKFSADDKYHGQVGNTVEITLRNLLFAPKDTLAYSAAGDHQIYVTGDAPQTPPGMEKFHTNMPSIPAEVKPKDKGEVNKKQTPPVPPAIIRLLSPTCEEDDGGQ